MALLWERQRFGGPGPHAPAPLFCPGVQRTVALVCPGSVHPPQAFSRTRHRVQPPLLVWRSGFRSSDLKELRSKPGTTRNAPGLCRPGRAAVWKGFCWPCDDIEISTCVVSRRLLFPPVWDLHCSLLTKPLENYVYALLYLCSFCNPHYKMGLIFLLCWVYQKRNS